MKHFFSSLILSGAILSGVALPATSHAEYYLGEIIWVGFNFCPRGSSPADGQLLAISSNTALFSLYGTLYGGDGRTTFALPDLRGRAAIHTGNGPGLTQRREGQEYGAESVTLTTNQMPVHSHTIGSASATLKANASTDELSSNTPAPENAVLANGQRAAVYSPAPADTDNMKAMDSSSITLSGSTGTSGGNYPVSVSQPSAVIRACVITSGIFPSRS
ncbi:MAG: phage tail protein [Thalassolituus sp.]|jgi:microcystin-dependent protein|uniref:phage tail protein n=1 Tax=uncultured Thalassolituus sp. TaxID=285273 RepID=UPI0026180BCC|nr:tail fiber protein [uncultured Thalassolituus sp.]TNC91860.1 MAG: phage tail protein [Thalassolituus sp.]